MTPTLNSTWNDFADRRGAFICTRVNDPAAADDLRQSVSRIETSTGLDCVPSPKFAASEPQGLEMLASNLKTETWLTELFSKVR